MQRLKHSEQRTESKILSTLTSEKREIHIEQLAAELGIARHTAAKYLEILRAKGKVRYRKVGNAKLWRAFSDVVLRPLTPSDIPAVLYVERLIEEDLGEIDSERFKHLEERIAHWIGESEYAVGAWLEERLLGFVLGEVRSWQFGTDGKTGWIEVIGIDPEFRRLGIGRALAEALLNRFRSNGAKKVCTLVDLYGGGLLSYFRSLGFQHMNMLPLEMRLTDTAPGTKDETGDRRKEADGGDWADHDRGN